MNGLGPLFGSMMVQNAFYTRPFFIGPSVAKQADFIDANAPPFCMAFKWPAKQYMPALGMSDGGDMTFTLNGNAMVKATDSACVSASQAQLQGMMTLIGLLQQGQTPPAPQTPTLPGVCRQTWGLLAPVLDQATATQLKLPGLDVGALPPRSDCQRMAHMDPTLKAQGMYQYGCPYDPIIGLGSAQMAQNGGIAITDNVTIDATVSGGENIGTFTVKGLKPAKRLEPESPFDLAQVDPWHPVTAAWKSSDADWVMIEIFAQLLPQDTIPNPLTIFELLMEKDPTKQAALQKKLGVRPQPKELVQLLCLEPASSRTKAIPDGALALIPKPAKGSGDAVMMMTTLMGLKMNQGAHGWGTSLFGLGRGSFGISCRESDGSQCTTMKEGLLGMLQQMGP